MYLSASTPCQFRAKRNLSLYCEDKCVRFAVIQLHFNAIAGSVLIALRAGK